MKIEKQKASIYQLKVTLKDTKPPAWRRILVHGDTKLDDLHYILQIAMGWTNSHLHMFMSGKTRYGEPDPDYDSTMKNEKRFRLEQIAFKKGDKLFYEYDFGDGWLHEIVVEKILDPDPQRRYPICIDGKRACPPEDVGGIGGYEDFLEAIMDPSNPEHGEMLVWVGDDFQPEFFDKDAVNKRLQKLFT